MEEMNQSPEVPQSGQPQGMSQPPAYAPPPPPRAWRKKPKSRPPIPMKFLAACVLGIILLTSGMIVQASVSFIIVLGEDILDPAEYDRNLVKNIGAIGSIISLIGTMILAIGLLSAGFLARDISPNARMGLFIAAGLVLGLVFGLSAGMTILPFYY